MWHEDCQWRHRLASSFHYTLHCGLRWPVGTSTIFQRLMTVPLHIPNGRQMPVVRLVQGKPLSRRWVFRADSSFASSQWETTLLCNDVSHWLGANLESALILSNQHFLYGFQATVFDNLNSFSVKKCSSKCGLESVDLARINLFLQSDGGDIQNDNLRRIFLGENINYRLRVATILLN